ncbi:type II toxin-antitoxin system VapC family toxin [Salinibacterium sp.]|uniref:type II toxin-antitoxin system VapC family toxin n=1 Tax=Salinibacterium sp. TaxID=1915057 RepID=UPI00286B53A1|nr:type II toxin-antitoxin system VapC family toxin [Salinibacterium sp.]
MIVLDTNVVSELMHAEPDVHVVSWLDAQQASTLCITAVTAAELFYGVERMASGKRRMRIASAIADMLEFDFADRVLPFDVSSSLEYGRIVGQREQLGHRIGMADAMIAATALSTGASLFATRNTKDFTDTDLRLVNPWISA